MIASRRSQASCAIRRWTAPWKTLPAREVGREPVQAATQVTSTQETREPAKPNVVTRSDVTMVIRRPWRTVRGNEWPRGDGEQGDDEGRARQDEGKDGRQRQISVEAGQSYAQSDRGRRVELRARRGRLQAGWTRWGREASGVAVTSGRRRGDVGRWTTNALVTHCPSAVTMAGVTDWGKRCASPLCAQQSLGLGGIGRRTQGPSLAVAPVRVRWSVDPSLGRLSRPGTCTHALSSLGHRSGR